METTKTVDLARVHFFTPAEGKTLRAQLEGKTLAGRDVVEYLRSLGFGDDEHFTPPSHWEKPRDRRIYGFSLTHITENTGGKFVTGFCWAQDGFHAHYRRFTGDPLDMLVGREWDDGDLILILKE